MKKLIAILIAAMSLLLVNPQPAHADLVIGVLYDGPNQTGASIVIRGNGCTGGGLNLPAHWNDRVSSYNSGTCRIQFWQHANYTGSSYFATRGTGNLPNYMNNQATSLRFYS